VRSFAAAGGGGLPEGWRNSKVRETRYVFCFLRPPDNGPTLSGYTALRDNDNIIIYYDFNGIPANWYRRKSKPTCLRFFSRARFFVHVSKTRRLQYPIYDPLCAYIIITIDMTWFDKIPILYLIPTIRVKRQWQQWYYYVPTIILLLPVATTPPPCVIYYNIVMVRSLINLPHSFRSRNVYNAKIQLN